MPCHITYVLDHRNRIEHVAGDWSSFADANDGRAIREHTQVVGRNVMDFLAGSETRSVYEQVFDKVRLTEKQVDIPFRCDAPDMRRYMRLEVYPLPHHALRIDSVELNASERPPFAALNRRSSRNSKAIQICSVCRRVCTEHQKWVEPEEFMQDQGLFIVSRHPNLVERVCHDCSAIAEGCRYILTGALEDEADQPTVVFLHGMLQGEWLLRLFAPPRLSVLENGPRYRLISPVIRKGERWSVRDIDEIVSQVVERHRLDRSRLYGTGVSAGGTALWHWAIWGKTQLAAVAPISCLLTVPSDPKGQHRARHLPVWAFSGAKDRLVPTHMTHEWMSRMRDINPEARVTTYRNDSHDVWSKVYSNPELWQWMFDKSVQHHASDMTDMNSI